MKRREINKKGRFKIFVEECKYWIGRLGLHNWKIFYEHNDNYSEDWEDGNLAMIRWNAQGRAATIWLNENWEEDHSTDFNIRQAAFHEIFELILTDFKRFSQASYRVDGSLERAVHDVIRTMENTMFKEDYERRKLSKKL